MNVIHLMYGPEETVNFVFPRVPMFPETQQLEPPPPPPSSQNVTEDTIHDAYLNGQVTWIQVVAIPGIFALLESSPNFTCVTVFPWTDS